MPDSGQIDNAVLAKLNGDATLLAMLPQGAHFEEAPAGSKRFVIVSLADEVDAHGFDGRVIEDAEYLVKAVALSTVATEANMRAAAARIDTLLEGGTLTATGYTLMTMHRTRRIRVTEVDDSDPSVRWFHRGGFYTVTMSAG